MSLNHKKKIIKKENKKLLTNVGNIYKSKYSKKINSLDTKNKKISITKKLRLGDNYQYSSEEEEEQKPTKDDYKTLNEQIIDEEININDDLFNKYFSFQRPSGMLMLLNKTNDTEKNNKSVNLMNSGLKDLKKKLERCLKQKKKLKTHNRQ